VRPTDTRLFAFAQREPVPLVGCFDTCVELGLIHLSNATQEKKTEAASETSAPSTASVVIKLTSEYQEVFSGLRKHKSIKAKLIVKEDVGKRPWERGWKTFTLSHINRDGSLTTLTPKAAKEEQRLKELNGRTMATSISRLLWPISHR